MMQEIKYYPVVDMDTEGLEKQAMLPTVDSEAVRGHHRFWLEEIVPHFFRLCSSEQKAAQDVSRFRIHCPYCGASLRPISPASNGRRHFLYTCDTCTKKQKENHK